MQTPLTTHSDVEARLHRDLTDAELEWIDGDIEEASVLVAAHLGVAVDQPVPDVVRIVTSRVVARSLTAARDDGATNVEQEADIYRERITFNADATSGGMWLTKTDKLELDRWSAARHAFSIDLTGTGRG